MSKKTSNLPTIPQAVELEGTVLGQILRFGDIFPDVLEVIPRPEILYSAPYQHIYRAMMALYQADVEIDVNSVASWLHDKGILTEHNISRADLCQLSLDVATAENAVYLARKVAEKYTQREVLFAAHKIIQKFEEGDAENIKEKASQLIHDAGRIESPTPPLHSQVTETIDLIEKGFHGHGVGYSWSLPVLDRVTGGIYPGKTTVLAALKKSGKTKLIIRTISELLATDVPVLFLSLEMRHTAVLRWIASYREKIDSSNLGTNRINDGERQAALHCLSSIASQDKLVIDDRSSLTLAQIRQKVRREVQRHSIKVVVLDFLQRAGIEQERGENRATAVQKFAYGMADIARDFNVGMVVVSQMSNEAEKADSIHLGFLKESGGIAEAADCIILMDHISRRKHETTRPGEKCKINLKVDAQRDGVSGVTVYTQADLRYGDFEERRSTEGDN